MKRLSFSLLLLLLVAGGQSQAINVPSISGVAHQISQFCAYRYLQVKKIITPYRTAVQVSVKPFVSGRDAAGVLAVMKPDLYLLCDERDFSNASELLGYLIQLSRKPFSGSIDKLTMKVLYEGNSLKGFVSYHRESADTGLILVLGVDRGARGKGYGTTLIKHAIDELCAQGVCKIHIDTGINNSTAQKCYTRNGFIKVSQDSTHMRLAYVPGNQKAYA